MANLMPFDELNNLKAYFSEKFKRDGRLEPDECVNLVLDILVIAYLYGDASVAYDLGIETNPSADLMHEAVFKRTDGLDFSDRVSAYAEIGDISGISVVAETEAHRVYGQGGDDAFSEVLKKNQSVKKVWRTMRDFRVRDSHIYLDGMEADEQGYFFSWDGHKAKYPGGFGVPELDINCRCYIDYKQK